MVSFHNLIIPIGDTNIDIMLTGSFLKESSNVLFPNTHFHPFFECHFSNSDNVQLNLNDTLYDLKAGNMVIIPPLYKHNYIRDYNYDECLSFSFTINNNKKIVKNSTYKLFSDIYSKINTAKILENTVNYNDVRRIYDFLHSNNPFKEYKEKSLFQTMFIDFSESLALELNSENYSVNDKTDEKNSIDVNPQYLIDWFFCQNYMCDISLDTFANYLNLSTRQANRVLKNIYQDSFGNMLLKTRMSVAQNFIINTDIPLTDLAYSVGYNSYNSFYVAFKKYFNMSPDDMRKNHRLNV